MEIEKKHGDVVVTIKLSRQELDDLRSHIHDLELQHCCNDNCNLWKICRKL